MSNGCNCPSPPGGRVECGVDQLAVCCIKDGEIRSYCFDLDRPPGAPASFVRNYVMGRLGQLLRDALPTEAAHVHITPSSPEGIVKDDVGRVVARFRLPAWLLDDVTDTPVQGSGFEAGFDKAVRELDFDTGLAEG